MRFPPHFLQAVMSRGGDEIPGIKRAKVWNSSRTVGGSKGMLAMWGNMVGDEDKVRDYQEFTLVRTVRGHLAFLDSFPPHYKITFESVCVCVSVLPLRSDPNTYERDS